MSGLLVRDICLCMKRKQSLLVFVAIAVLFGVMMDGFFGISYMTFLMLMYAVGNMNYDESGNGYPYLFTMPITRKTYVLEKYLFPILAGAGGFVFSVLIAVVIQTVKGTLLDYFADPTGMFAFLPCFLFLLALYIPIQLQFGMERSRIVLIIITACVCCCGYAIAKMTEVDLESVLAGITSAPIALVGISVVLLCVLLLAISFLVSVKIIEKKEY